MPTIGEITRKSSHKYLWLACPDCGKQRWVPIIKEQPKYQLCHKCAKLPGPLNPNWKGGRSKQQSGYIILYAPDHPRATKHGYVREHILVWERAHNKSLPDGWVVHHINGIKDDNRPRNLVALPKGKHHGQELFQTLKQRIRELELENKLLEKALDTSQMIFKIEEN